MALNTFQDEYMQIPPVTRAYTTSCVLTTLAVQLDILTPFQLYFNPDLILRHGQVWRLVTNFLFFGTIGFNFLFNIIFTYRYCRMLEETSFRGRTADFFYMFLFGGVMMILIGCFVNLVFLGQAFTIMLVYVWSRRNPYIRMNFFGLLNFHAPYLPWILLLFSLLLGNSVMVDFLGMLVGHIYYYLEDVFPNLYNGTRLLKTPRIIQMLFEGGNRPELVDQGHVYAFGELIQEENLFPAQFQNAEPLPERDVENDEDDDVSGDANGDSHRDDVEPVNPGTSSNS